MTEARPYRSNVGIALFDARGRVLIAKRLGDDGPEAVAPGCDWQMPQGGIDADEEPERAARRELAEETGAVSVRLLAVHPAWLTYEFPPYIGPPHRLQRFRGQRQRWFAMQFEGDEGEIDVTRAVDGVPPEFSTWRWEALEGVADLVAPFKRAIYREVAQTFASFARG